MIRLSISVPGEGYFRHASCILRLSTSIMSTFILTLRDNVSPRLIMKLFSMQWIWQRRLTVSSLS